MKVDGSESVTLAPLGHQFAASWSSDGRRIAFLGSKAPISNPVDYNEVYLARADGGELKQITTAPGAYASPVWLPRRAELLYASNTFASPQTGGASQTSAVLFRYDVGSGQTRTLLSLTSRIITAIEPSPDGRLVAFLSWRTDDPGAGTLFLHLSDPEGDTTRELGLVSSDLVAAGGGPFGPKDALALGGDLTWSSGGRLSAAGRVIDLATWKIDGRIDPDNDAYATRTGSRTLFAADGVCAWFNDTRQIMKRCLPEKTARPEADCRGALLWMDAARGHLGLFDAVTGSVGIVQLPPPRP
jgi:dipeptidyl aminopeptidase/acylaminoacyl peptidase